MKLFRLAVCAAMFAITVGAIAQTSPGDLVVDVPFAFSAAGQKFLAGHYIIQQHNDMIRILGNHHQSLFAPTHAALRTEADGSKLVFDRYGDNYFLSAIWVTGNESGKQLFPSRAERELKAKRSEMEMAVVRPAQ